MVPSEQASETGYHRLWNAAVIRPLKQSQASRLAQKIKDNKSLLLEIEHDCNGVPWQFIGCCWLRESDMNIRGTLSDGELIIGTNRKTQLEPKNRGPYATFQESAVDELVNHRHLDKVQRWSVERICFEWEAYNGWGYLGKCNSPYLWSWTTMYGPPESKGGKYPRDHYFDPNAIDVQPGCIAIIKSLMIIDVETAARFQEREPIAPKAVIDETKKKITSKTRKISQGAGGAATAGGASEATKQSTGHDTFIPSPIAIGMIGCGVTIAIVAIMLTVRKGNLLKARW